MRIDVRSGWGRRQPELQAAGVLEQLSGAGADAEDGREHGGRPSSSGVCILFLGRALSWRCRGGLQSVNHVGCHTIMRLFRAWSGKGDCNNVEVEWEASSRLSTTMLRVTTSRLQLAIHYCISRPRNAL